VFVASLREKPVESLETGNFLQHVYAAARTNFSVKKYKNYTTARTIHPVQQ
jgi:hypothetical protein